MEGSTHGFLAYASVVNMKVAGTLGDECSIAVQASPAMMKSKPKALVGLLALDRHAHLNVLAYLEPTWVHWGGGGGGGEREREPED
jgi:hypothetical protein